MPPPHEQRPETVPARRPSAGLFLRVWVLVGLQSFGGGATTLALIRRAIVEQHAWIDGEEFSRLWALCQIAPGINLMGLTILVGKRVLGLRGSALATAGLILPSAAVTLCITAVYARVQGSRAVAAALRGVVPATVGLGLVTAWNLARPLLRSARRQGTSALVVGVALLAGAGAAASRSAPVLLVLLAAGVAGALLRAAGGSRA